MCSVIFNMEDQVEPKWFTKFRETLDIQLKEMDRKLDEYKKVKEIAEQNRAVIYELKKENASLGREIENLKHKLISNEAQSRRNNLIFEGLMENQNETWTDCENKIYELLETKLGIQNAKTLIKFERVHRLGPYIPDNKRAVVAKFSFYKDRDTVWKKRSSLKGTNIWISEDYPVEIQSARKILFPIMRHAQKMSTEGQATKVSLSMDKLILNGKPFTIKDLDKLPEKLRPENISTKTEGEVTVFYTRNSMLSNFYMNAPFKLNGIKYNCTEQHFQQAKALHFGDEQTAFKIMTAKDSHEQCQLGKKVKGYNDHEWQKVAKTVLLKANIAKFEQNEAARRVLLNTGANLLGEASRSKVWGIGLSLGDNNVTNPDHWSGQNIFGQVLQQVRDTLKTKHL